jgi:hypothetical protein
MDPGECIVDACAADPCGVAGGNGQSCTVTGPNAYTCTCEAGFDPDDNCNSCLAPFEGISCQCDTSMGEFPDGMGGCASGQLFSDDFDGDELDPAWTELNGSFSVSGGGHLVESSGVSNSTSELLWGGGLTDWADQYAKLRLVSLGSRSWGFMLRFTDSSGHHYQVHLTAGTSEWRWDLHDSDFVEQIDSCLGDQAPVDDDWLGVAIEGAGPSTKVSVWRWDGDPDPGDPDPLANWGLPDCQMQADPSVDAGGRAMGIRSYTFGSAAPSSIDNWSGGDLLGSIP